MMASDANLGQIFQADRALSRLWDTVPTLPIQSERATRRKTPNETNTLFDALVDNKIVAVAITSLDKRWLKVNDKWCEMIGYSREELASVDWAELTHPDDLASNIAQFNRVLSGEIQGYTLAKRFLRKNGEILCAEISVTAVRGADGAIKYFVGLGIDATERKQAEQSLADMTRKLIEAQEQERARIGRQLHDDIGQRLALLALDIDLLAEENPSRRLRGLRDLRTQIDEISRDVQTLSHDLHAAKLEYLGALAGIKSWCMDFGQRYKIHIGFTGDVRSPLPGGVGICLFRVVQEALQNVVKHSGANRAEVSFRECDNEVHLVIRDPGRGFDRREVSGGLGLISMRERIRTVDGTLTIESGRMRGTSILVRVPMPRTRKLRIVAGTYKKKI